MLSYSSFRRLWLALSLSSFGDWMGFLATTALAGELAGGGPAAREASLAIGGVLVARLMPAVLLGPLAGVFADRFDRRRTMVVCDLLRFAVFASIPLVRELPYLLAASFVVEAISLFWIPAKEASVPNLLPPQKLEAANQISLITTYGTAPLAAAVFIGLAKLTDLLGAAIGFFDANPVDLALYFNAATFLFAALTVSRLHEIGGARRLATAEDVDGEPGKPPGFFRDIADGWKFVGSTPLIRGLVVGILGAFAAGGAAIGLGRPFVGLLGGGDAAYGLLFGAIFTGLAVGMALGPRLLADVSRRRLFGVAIVVAGASLSIMALLPNLVLALIATFCVGIAAGVAWIVGYTLLGLEVEDDKRGRTFATVQSLVRVDLLVVLPASTGISGWIGLGREIGPVTVDGPTTTLLVAGLIAVGVGLVSYRQMDDGDVPLWREVARALPWLNRRTEAGGVFIALEGGEGAGKSTQARLLAEWLAPYRDDVVVTFEPGATKAGAAIRKVLLSPAQKTLTPRAEAMLYAADRADHVDNVIRPALERGAVVITDRFVDSSLAYQGGGRTLPMTELRRLSQWATGGLRPDLTILLDLDPAVGLARAGGRPDRMEQESLAFHERVRTAFRELAHQGRYRYVIVDASRPVDEVAAEVRGHVERRLGAMVDTAAGDREPVTT